MKLKSMVSVPSHSEGLLRWGLISGDATGVNHLFVTQNPLVIIPVCAYSSPSLSVSLSLSLSPFPQNTLPVTRTATVPEAWTSSFMIHGILECNRSCQGSFPSALTCWLGLCDCAF